MSAKLPLIVTAAIRWKLIPTRERLSKVTTDFLSFFVILGPSRILIYDHDRKLHKTKKKML